MRRVEKIPLNNGAGAALRRKFALRIESRFLAPDFSLVVLPAGNVGERKWDERDKKGTSVGTSGLCERDIGSQAGRQESRPTG